jgi:exonuclease SbcD
MRFLHTADWHLGRELFAKPLISCQQQALEQIQSLAAKLAGSPEGLDAILIAGDLYDRVNPSPQVLDCLSKALCKLSEIAPLVLISGNHDRGELIEFAAPALRQAQIHTFGKFQWPPPIVELGTNPTTSLPQARIIPIPYLEPLVARTHFPELQRQATHQEVWALLAKKWRDLPSLPDDGVPLILMAHAFASQGTSGDTELPLAFLGGAESVDPSTLLGHGFFDYGALGHLHRPQKSGPDGRVRYPGSLFPYSLEEARFVHGLLEVTIEGRGSLPSVTFHPLQPLQRVREIQLDLADLETHGPKESEERRQDFVYVRLSSTNFGDRSPMAFLRSHYPNILSLHAGPETGARGPTPEPGTDEVSQPLVDSSHPHPTEPSPSLPTQPAQWLEEFLQTVAEGLDLKNSSAVAVEAMMGAAQDYLTRLSQESGDTAK